MIETCKMNVHSHTAIHSGVVDKRSTCLSIQGKESKGLQKPSLHNQVVYNIVDNQKTKLALTYCGIQKMIGSMDNKEKQQLRMKLQINPIVLENESDGKRVSSL